MDRYILTDAQWAKMEPHCLGKVTDRGRSGTIIDYFLKPYCGLHAQVAHGEIYHLNLVNGIPFLNAIEIG